MVFGKLRDGVNNPELVRPYINDFRESIAELLSEAGILKSADFVFTEAGGRSFYVPYLYWKNRATELQIKLFGNQLLFPLSHKGISYELIMHGQREHKATDIFRRELRRVNEEVEEVTVVEAGANIGYYLLQETELLDSNAQIHAFEPVPDNVHMLRKNLLLNDVEENVDIAPVAASAERGSVEMEVNTESNWARVSDEGEVGTTPVESWPIDDYLKDQGQSTSDVNVVRMDVEGYEADVLRGMEETLSESSPLLLFMELHASYLRERDELDPILDLFEEHDFKLVSAVVRRTELEMSSIDDLRSAKGAPNIFLYKEG